MITSPLGMSNWVNNAVGQNGGWYEGDPSYRSAERKLTRSLGNEIAMKRNRLLQAGYSPADVDRMLMSMTIGAGNNFANLYDSEAARIKAIQEQRAAERRNFWHQLVGTAIGMGGGALIQAGLNKQLGSYMNSMPDGRSVGPQVTWAPNPMSLFSYPIQNNWNIAGQPEDYQYGWGIRR